MGDGFPSHLDDLLEGSVTKLHTFLEIMLKCR